MYQQDQNQYNYFNATMTTPIDSTNVYNSTSSSLNDTPSYSNYYQSPNSNNLNYSWSNYQSSYPNYDYNSYSMNYYKNASNLSVSSPSNYSFNASTSDNNSNLSNESSLSPSLSYQSVHIDFTSPKSFPNQLQYSPVSSAPTISSIQNYESTPLPLPESPRKVSKQIKKPNRHQQLCDRAVEIMNDWFMDHINNPYPQPVEKEQLAKLGGITVKQVTAWFSNRRNRSQNTKPKRMKRVLEQEINNIFSELIGDQASKDAVISKVRSTLGSHELNF